MEAKKEIWTDIYGVKWDSHPPKWMRSTKYIRADIAEQQNKDLKELAQEFGEFSVRCDREEMHLLTFEGFLELNKKAKQN